MNDPPTITAHPQSLTKDPGDAATFTVAAAGAATLTHQWRKGGSDISGATSSSYTIASAQESDEGSYDCVISNSAGTATSNAVTLTVNDPPAITAQPQSLTKDPAESATFTVTATGTATLTYQWRKDGSDISGATSASYTIASVQESDEGSYDCVVSNSIGSATSDAATLTLNLPPLAPDTPSPADDATDVALDVTLDWADALRATTYSIYLGTDPPARPSFTRQTADVEIDAEPDGWAAPGELHAADLNGDGDLDVLSASLDDDSVAWYENDGQDGFTEHPISSEADDLLAVNTADVDGDGDLDILAMSVLDDKVVLYENTIAGTVTTDLTSSSFQPAAPLTAGQLYYWRVRAENVNGTIWGATWQFTAASAPAITAQPQSLTQDPGDAATFTVAATGTATLSYQWRKDASDISGATSASYTIASVQESDEGSFDCVVTNSQGSATSNAATLTVNDPPVVAAHPQSLAKDPGDAATFTVTASGTATLTYQWRKDAGNISGATSASYTIAAVQESDEGSFDCVVTNSQGSATSNAATLTVNDPPVITSHPQALTKSPGEDATFSVTATGAATLTYQWRKGGSNISGATSASYTIASVQESDEGSFDCVVTNSAGAATSNAATLTVNDPPAITAQPQPLAKDPGESASFTVAATSAVALTYQWRKDGNDIVDATSATYTIASVQESDEGSYDCVITGSAGTATSNAATLTVTDPPPTPTGVTARALAAYGKLVLKWTASPGATGYRIYYDDEDTPPLGPPVRSGVPTSGALVGNVTRVIIKGLKPGRRHYLGVVAYNSAGDSLYSATVTARAGNTLKTWVTGSIKVRPRRKYRYRLKLKWNSGAINYAPRSTVKWSVDRRARGSATIGRSTGVLAVKRTARNGRRFYVMARYRGKTYRKTVRVARSAGRPSLAAANPVLLYRLSSRLTTLGDGRDVQRRGGKLFIDPAASQFTAIVTWRDAAGDHFYQRQDWHDQDLANNLVDGPDDAAVQAVTALSRAPDSFVLRHVTGRPRELTLGDATFDAARRFSGVETSLDAGAASYSTTPLLARLDLGASEDLVGTDLETAVAEFVAELEGRGFVSAPAPLPKRHSQPPADEEPILVYRQSQRSAVLGNGEKLPLHRGGFLVVDPANNLATSISTWVDADDNRFHSRQDWHASADLLLNYDVDAGRRRLHVLAAVTGVTEADSLTAFDLAELRGAIKLGGSPVARILKGRLRAGSASGDAAYDYAYSAAGKIGARLDSKRTRAATATGDHAQAVADILDWLEDERGSTLR